MPFSRKKKKKVAKLEKAITNFRSVIQGGI